MPEIVIGAIGLMFVTIELFIGIRSLRIDHDRRKKDATLSHVSDISDRWDELKFTLDKDFGWDEPLTNENIDEIEKDYEQRDNLRRLLRMVEHIALGANIDVFDKVIIYRMANDSLTTIYKRLSPYINHLREEYDSETVYVEFETMLDDFKTYKPLIELVEGNIGQVSAWSSKKVKK